RFGGEEFAILLPETAPEQAIEIADRIRRAVAEEPFEIDTSSEPIRATISLGVAGFPKDGTDSNELIHQADLAVYRAKLQGRNRVLGASSDPLLLADPDVPQRLASVPAEEELPTVGAVSVGIPSATALPRAVASSKDERRSNPRPH